MQAVIQKWGNSLGIRIPGNLARGLHLKNGSFVDIAGEDDKIIIRPKSGKNLREMLESIDENNIHGEVCFGGAKGNEAW